MDELQIYFDNGDSIIYKYGQLELRDKRNFGYCPYGKIEDYILLYWEQTKEKSTIIIGNIHMKKPKKYMLSCNSEYYDNFECLYNMMVERAKCDLQSTLVEAEKYNVPYKPVIIKKSEKVPDKSNIIKEVDENQARCPRCGSTSLSANKKGFGMGKAVVGTLAFGVIGGALAGSIGAKKIEVTCLKCGKKFKV